MPKVMEQPQRYAFSSQEYLRMGDAEDILLVVEVADSTWSFDLETKIPLYARAGILEAWVVDVEHRAVRVFRDPDAGAYRKTFTSSGDQSMEVTALPDVSIGVDEIFPT